MSHVEEDILAYCLLSKQELGGPNQDQTEVFQEFPKRKMNGRKRAINSEGTANNEEDKENSEKLSKRLNLLTDPSIQSSCSENLKFCTEKMIAQYIHKLGEAQVGDTVHVPVPDVDRGP